MGVGVASAVFRWRSHPYTNTSSSGHSPDDEVRKGDEGGREGCLS